MNFNRFRNIIIKNRENELSVKITLKKFQEKVILNGDISKIMKEIGAKLETIIIEIPMRDCEFGACYLQTDYSKYLLLNSNQPRSKMYFSFCHDIYHILEGNPEHINDIRQVHLNKDYYFENEIESKANLFAANLLMPELEFIKMFDMFKKDMEDIEFVIIKLMNYFSSPFLSVVIRLYELNILKDLDDAKKLLSLDNNKIEELFERLWIEKDILKPSLKDEMCYVLEKIEGEGQRLIDEDLLSKFNFDNIKKRINELYHMIRMKNDE